MKEQIAERFMSGKDVYVQFKGNAGWVKVLCLYPKIFEYFGPDTLNKSCSTYENVTSICSPGVEASRTLKEVSSCICGRVLYTPQPFAKCSCGNTFHVPCVNDAVSRASSASMNHGRGPTNLELYSFITLLLNKKVNPHAWVGKDFNPITGCVYDAKTDEFFVTTSIKNMSDLTGLSWDSSLHIGKDRAIPIIENVLAAKDVWIKVDGRWRKVDNFNKKHVFFEGRFVIFDDVEKISISPVKIHKFTETVRHCYTRVNGERKSLAFEMEEVSWCEVNSIFWV